MNRHEDNTVPRADHSRSQLNINLGIYRKDRIGMMVMRTQSTDLLDGLNCEATAPGPSWKSAYP
jgi:hypothetical protein